MALTVERIRELSERYTRFEEQVQNLEADGAAVPLRPAGGGRGGSGGPRLVAKLPPIPAGYDVVVWASSDYITGGNGDNQIWECDGRVGQTEWTPRQKATSKSGEPVEEE